MKRAVIVHGWEGYPSEAWFPWLKGELETRGWHVEVPAMPEAGTPRIEAWVGELSRVVDTPDEELMLIGHSIGVQTILRYLETIDVRIAKVVAVAGFFTLVPHSIGSAEDEAVAEPWLTLPIDTERVRRNVGEMVALFSDDDRYIPFENIDLFERRLGAKVSVLHARGHMGANDHAEVVPEILEACL